VKRAGRETIAEQKTGRPAYFRRERRDAARAFVSRHRGIYPIRLYPLPRLRGRVRLALTALAGRRRVATLEGRLDRGRHRRRARASRASRHWRGAETRAFAAGRGGAEAGFSLESSLGDYATIAPAGRIAYRFSLELIGTAQLMLGPVGDTTKIRIVSYNLLD
jgi:hypothetical protein